VILSNSNVMALGDLFYEATGRITSQRVLNIKGPTIETTVSNNVRIMMTIRTPH
jgi:Na+-transporting NADH:ubiquinone oxidoreductase subunit NqrA